MRFLLGPLAVILGILLIKYSFWMTNQSGKIDFVEQYMSSFGGTYLWWKLVGIAIIILALAWMGGYLDFGSAAVQMPTN